MTTARHEPLLLATSRYGCWCQCTCGWLSSLWTTTIGAHIEFGLHLLNVGNVTT